MNILNQIFWNCCTHFGRYSICKRSSSYRFVIVIDVCKKKKYTIHNAKILLSIYNTWNRSRCLCVRVVLSTNLIQEMCTPFQKRLFKWMFLAKHALILSQNANKRAKWQKGKKTTNWRRRSMWMDKMGVYLLALLSKDCVLCVEMRNDNKCLLLNLAIVVVVVMAQSLEICVFFSLF